MSLKFVKTSFQYATATLGSEFNSIATTDFSISMWAKVTDFTYYGQWSRLLDGKYDANNFVQFCVPIANKIQFVVHDAGTDRPIVTDSTLNANQWYHLVGVWIASTNTVRLYVDAVNNTTAGDTSTVSPGTAGILNIGRRSDADSTNTFYSGFEDDLRIYNRALTQAEIDTIYACQGCDAIVQGLVRHYRLDEGYLGQVASGSNVLKDLTNAPLHATPGASPTWDESILHVRRIIQNV